MSGQEYYQLLSYLRANGRASGGRPAKSQDYGR